MDAPSQKTISDAKVIAAACRLAEVDEITVSSWSFWVALHFEITQVIDRKPSKLPRIHAIKIDGVTFKSPRHDCSEIDEEHLAKWIKQCERDCPQTITKLASIGITIRIPEHLIETE